jgi:hypothetical protein
MILFVEVSGKDSDPFEVATRLAILVLNVSHTADFAVWVM